MPYDESLMTALCERIGSGETLRSLAKEFGIDRAAIFRWVTAHPAAADHYARARELQADAHFDEIVDAARALDIAARDGAITSEQVQAHRAAIDARKWAASKLKPKVYGDRLDIALEHRAELLVLDYGRSEAAKIIDVPASVDAKLLGTGHAAPLVTERKRVPKRHRKMSAARRAKWEANSKKHAEAQRAAREAAKGAKVGKKARARRAVRKRGRG